MLTHALISLRASMSRAPPAQQGILLLHVCTAPRMRMCKQGSPGAPEVVITVGRVVRGVPVLQGLLALVAGGLHAPPALAQPLQQLAVRDAVPPAAAGNG